MKSYSLVNEWRRRADGRLGGLHLRKAGSAAPRLDRGSGDYSSGAAACTHTSTCRTQYTHAAAQRANAHRSADRTRPAPTHERERASFGCLCAPGWPGRAANGAQLACVDRARPQRRRDSVWRSQLSAHWCGSAQPQRARTLTGSSCQPAATLKVGSPARTPSAACSGRRSGQRARAVVLIEANGKPRASSWRDHACGC